MHWRRKWQPTPVFLPGEPQGRGSLVGCHLWGRTGRTRLKRLSSSSSSTEGRTCTGSRSGCKPPSPTSLTDSRSSPEHLHPITRSRAHLSHHPCREPWDQAPATTSAYPCQADNDQHTLRKEGTSINAKKALILNILNPHKLLRVTPTYKQSSKTTVGNCFP
ncbi:unnamed protein product [Rangifer tarandus platyrhynchus]|uniref:Uncharacterized protein n=1 Tax=Rangifer tarandus platyrhynchus TaxID=3082113 RepID=A0AC59Y7Z1_RANTA